MSETTGNVRTIVMLTEDRPGMILDIAEVLLTAGFTIRSHVAGPCEKKKHARFTILMAPLPGISSNSDTVQVIDALKSLNGVERAEDITDQKIVARELALIKVETSATQKNWTQVIHLAGMFHVEPIDVMSTRLILAASDTSERIDHFCILLRDVCRIEVLKRTGIVAMISGEAPEQHREPSQEVVA